MYTYPGVRNKTPRYMTGNNGGGAGMNPYSAGRPSYGGGRPMPNIGGVSGAGARGYAVRDRLAQSRKQLALKRMQFSNSRQMGM